MNRFEGGLPVREGYFLQISADTNKQNGLPLSQGSVLIHRWRPAVMCRAQLRLLVHLAMEREQCPKTTLLPWTPLILPILARILSCQWYRQGVYGTIPTPSFPQNIKQADVAPLLFYELTQNWCEDTSAQVGRSTGRYAPRAHPGCKITKITKQHPNHS